MSRKIIEITISPEGKTIVRTKGFAGSSCRDATRLIENALGRVTGETVTTEFHQAQAGQHQKLSHG